MLKNLCKFLLILSLFLGLWPGLAGGVAVEAAGEVKTLPLTETGWFSAKGAGLVTVDGNLRAFVNCNETNLSGGDTTTGAGEACLGYFLRDKGNGQIVQTGDPVSKTVNSSNYEIVTVRASPNPREDQILQLPDSQYKVYKIPGTFQQPDLLVVQNSAAQGNSAGNYIAMQADTVNGFNQVNRLNEEGVSAYVADLTAKINSADNQAKLSLTGASVVGVNTNTSQTAARDESQVKATELSKNGATCTSTLGKDNKAIFECVKDGKKVGPDGTTALAANCVGFTLKEGTNEMENACVAAATLQESKNLQTNNTAAAAGAPTNNSKSLAAQAGDNIAIKMLNFIGALLLVLVYFIGWVVIIVVWILLKVFIWVLRVNPAGVEFVQVAVEPWQVVIGLANLIVLFWFIMVGFGYLLNIKDLKKGIQEFLLNLVIYTLALNFSLLAVATVVNISQGVGEIMLGSISATQNKRPDEVLIGGLLDGVAVVSTLRCGNIIERAAKENDPTILEECKVDSQSGGFGEFVKTVGGGLTLGTTDALGNAFTGNFGDIFRNRTGGAASHLMMEATFVAILVYIIYHVWKGVYLVLTRTVGLWMFMVCSPLILACKLSPFPQLQKKADEFINTGFQFIIFYPAMIFGLALVATLSRSFGLAISRQGTSFNGDISSTNLPGFIQAYAAGDVTVDDYLRTFMIAVLIAAVATAAFGTLINWFESSFSAVAKTVLGGLKSMWNIAKEGTYLAGTPVREIGDRLKKNKYVQAVTGNESFKKMGEKVNKYTGGGAGALRRTVVQGVNGELLNSLEQKAKFAKQIFWDNHMIAAKDRKDQDAAEEQERMNTWLNKMGLAHIFNQKYNNKASMGDIGPKEVDKMIQKWLKEEKNEGKTEEDFWSERRKTIRLQASLETNKNAAKVLKEIGQVSMSELVKKVREGATNINQLEGPDLERFIQYLQENINDIGLRNEIMLNDELKMIVEQLYDQKILNGETRKIIDTAIPTINPQARKDAIDDLLDPYSNRRNEIDASFFQDQKNVDLFKQGLDDYEAKYGQTETLNNLREYLERAVGRNFDKAKNAYAEVANNSVPFQRADKAVEAIMNNPEITADEIVANNFGNGGRNNLGADFGYVNERGVRKDFTAGQGLNEVVEGVLTDRSTDSHEKINILKRLASQDANFANSDFYKGYQKDLENDFTGLLGNKEANEAIGKMTQGYRDVKENYGPGGKKYEDAKKSALKKLESLPTKLGADGFSEAAIDLELDPSLTNLKTESAVKIGLHTEQKTIISTISGQIQRDASSDPTIRDFNMNANNYASTEAPRIKNETKRELDQQYASALAIGRMTSAELDNLILTTSTAKIQEARDAKLAELQEAFNQQKAPQEELVQKYQNEISQKAMNIIAMKVNGNAPAAIANHIRDLNNSIIDASVTHGILVDPNILSDVQNYVGGPSTSTLYLNGSAVSLQASGTDVVRKEIEKAEVNIPSGAGAKEKTAKEVEKALKELGKAADKEVKKNAPPHKRQKPASTRNFAQEAAYGGEQVRQQFVRLSS